MRHIRLILVDSVDKADFRSGDFTYHFAGIDGIVYRPWWTCGVINAALHPMSLFHGLQRLREGAICDGLKISFDIIEVARRMKGGQDWQRPRST